jgi:hypothetical protein
VADDRLARLGLVALALRKVRVETGLLKDPLVGGFACPRRIAEAYWALEDHLGQSEYHLAVLIEAVEHADGTG